MHARDATDEFSFRLKPSAHGIGVCILHDVAEGVKLLVQPDGYVPRVLREEEVPPELLTYCEARPENDGTYYCPQDFSAMPVSWFINHSRTPNVRLAFGAGSATHYAARDLRAGEELFIDYRALDEPEEAREDFY